MQYLNLPPYSPITGRVGEAQTIFDPVRSRYVRLTPEEWVRQHFIQFLHKERGFPMPLLAVEVAFKAYDQPRRADLVAYDRAGKPLLVAECKAPEVRIQQAAFDQVAEYNVSLRAPYIVVTNGIKHFCCLVDFEARSYRFLDQVPSFASLINE